MKKACYRFDSKLSRLYMVFLVGPPRVELGTNGL